MKPKIFKILRIAAGRFHSICESSVGKIKKPNTVVYEPFGDTYWKGVKPEKPCEEIENAKTEEKVGSNNVITKLNMTKELLFRDTLLYIAIIVTSYGAAVLEANFTNGIIALLCGAGLTILRTLLKKQ